MSIADPVGDRNSTVDRWLSDQRPKRPTMYATIDQSWTEFTKVGREKGGDKIGLGPTRPLNRER
eukprot:5527603-Pyramimonas_sp.AAC.1